jgi:ribosomal protein S18 acetylase RimI-like enzyme
MDARIRQASDADMDALVALNGVVQGVHARIDPTHFKSEVDPGELRVFFHDLLSKSENWILVAEQRSVPVGYVWFELQDRPTTPFSRARRRFYVHHIVVYEAVRRSGVALSLLQAVEAQARENGVANIALDAWAANKNAQQFFEASGFQPFNLVLGKILS